jgi:hypothetical protein
MGPKYVMVGWENKTDKTIDILIDFDRIYKYLIHFVVVSTATFGWFGLFIPVAPTWSMGHPWNASFHFSFLI